MKKLFIISALLLLSACIKVEDIPEETKPLPQSVNFNLEEEIRIEDLDGPNQYQVALNLPSNAVKVIRREKGISDSAVELSLADQKDVLRDSHIQAGKSYVYQIWQADQASATVREISVPVDLEISHPLELHRDEVWTQYRRIFLTENNPIQTKQFNLTITADQIISSKGVIQNFPSQSQSPEGQSGLSGGVIKIQVRTGKGSLLVELSGQNGANGIPGKDEAIINIGGPGMAGGDTGGGDLKIEENHQLQVQAILRKGKGGRRGPPGRPWMPGHIGFAGIGQDGQDGNVGIFCLYDFKGQTCAGQEGLLNLN